MKLKNFNIIVITLLVIMVSVISVVIYKAEPRVAPNLSGDISIETPTVTAGLFRTYQFFASSTVPTTIATTTSATSTNITPFFSSAGVKDNGYMDIAGAKDVTLYFTRGDALGQGNTGTSTFRVQISPDGTNWHDYNALRQATTTIATADKFYTYYGEVIIKASTSTQIMKMAELGWQAVRCIVLEGVDGEHTCKATAQY